MSEVEDSGYKYLGVLEWAYIKKNEMKDKVRQSYLRKIKLVAKSKFYSGILIKAKTVWVVSAVRYSTGILGLRDYE